MQCYQAFCLLANICNLRSALSFRFLSFLYISIFNASYQPAIVDPLMSQRNKSSDWGIINKTRLTKPA